MPEPTAGSRGIDEPYVSGTFMFQSRQWRKRFPQGLTFKFGLGTVAAATVVATIASIALLDYVGVVDSKAAWKAIVESLPDISLTPPAPGTAGGGEAAASWLNALVPITALDDLLRGG